jgi:NodT family efflux transporter outer membrane factor (OMF) lipoprotein
MTSAVDRCRGRPKPTTRANAWVVAAIVLLAVLLSSCSVGPDFRAPVPPTGTVLGKMPARTASAEGTAGAGQTFQQGRDIPGDWWRLFGSPEIDALVRQALRANPSLAAAQATLREAKENVRAEQGSYFPTLTGGVSATRQRGGSSSGVQAGSSAETSLYSGSLNVSYTFDAFGGIDRAVEQLQAQATYQRDELEAAYLTLTADLVTAAITEASLKAQIDTTQALIKLYGNALDITQRRFELGGVSRADVLQQQASLAAEVATLPNLQKQYGQERDLVARYLGGMPGAYTAPTIDLAALTLPADLPLSLPSQVVRQRPDIQAYEALLHSATAELGIATANLYPQFTLTGSYSREGSDLSKIFTPEGIVWSIAGAITQPIFEGGTLLARKRSAQAALDVAAAEYSSTLNTAFQNVADSLVAIEADAHGLQAQEQSQKTAAASLAVTRAQFGAGATPYLSLLQAQQTYQSAQLQLVIAQAARFTDTVALYQSLGGGWWNRRDVDPTVNSCCGIMP